MTLASRQCAGFAVVPPVNLLIASTIFSGSLSPPTAASIGTTRRVTRSSFFRASAGHAAAHFCGHARWQFYCSWRTISAVFR